MSETDFQLGRRAGRALFNSGTTQQNFETGRGLWLEYVRVNGYAFEPNEKGLKRLSRLLDLNIPYLRCMINAFLEA